VVYEITDLNSLWVEARLYNQEAAGIEEGDIVNIIPTALPNETIRGKVAFINPELQDGSQYSLLRINISNNALKFRPGMQAYVQITSTATKGIALPADALIRYAHSTIVWVSTSNNTFEPRLVQTGITAQGITEIIAGLSVGDIVVITGAYLLNSEFTFKRGMAPTPAAEHQDMKM
jgi:Cu(I)/Ag(I) efflux system membrane fusion protein